MATIDKPAEWKGNGRPKWSMRAALLLLLACTGGGWWGGSGAARAPRRAGEAPAHPGAGFLAGFESAAVCAVAASLDASRIRDRIDFRHP